MEMARAGKGKWGRWEEEEDNKLKRLSWKKKAQCQHASLRSSFLIWCFGSPSSPISSVLWSFMNPSFCPFTPLLLEQTPPKKRDKELCTISKACGFKKNRSVKHNSNRKQRKSRQEGDEREKRGRVMSRHPVDPQRSPFPHLHQRNQTSHGCTGVFFFCRG